MHTLGLEKIILKKGHSVCTKKKLKSQSTCLNLVGVRGGASSWFDSRGEISPCCGVSLSSKLIQTWDSIRRAPSLDFRLQSSTDPLDVLADAQGEEIIITSAREKKSLGKSNTLVGERVWIWEVGAWVMYSPTAICTSPCRPLIPNDLNKGSRCSKSEMNRTCSRGVDATNRARKRVTTYLVDLRYDPLGYALARGHMCAQMVVDSRKMAPGGGERGT